MNLKGLFFTLALVITSNLTVFSQDAKTYNEDNCKKYRSLYYQYLKQNMFRDACTFWAQAVTDCGDSLDGKFWGNGRIAYLRLIKETDEKDTTTINGLNDTIAWIYEQKMLIEKDPYWELDYAVFLISNKSADNAKLDELFKNIHVLKEGSSSTHIRMYFRFLIVNKFNGAAPENKDIERANIIEEYIVLSDYLAAAMKATANLQAEDEKEREIKSIEGAQDFLDKYFLKIAQDCGSLTPVLDKKFESLPTDKVERMKHVTKYMNLLEKQKCTDSETYEKYVVEATKLEPTAAVFFGLATIQMNKDKVADAIKSLEKAIELEGEGENKNAYTYALAQAQYKGGQYNTAFRTAKTIEGEYKGKAMVICGNCIAALSGSCGESTFARNANYWLANDYYQRAISLGESVSSSKFLSNAPTAEDCFGEGVSMGASYTLTCWGESTTVR